MALYSGSDQKNLTKCEICLNLMRSSSGQQKCKARKQSGLVISHKQTANSTIGLIYLILTVSVPFLYSHKWTDCRRDNQDRNERSCCPLNNRTTWWTIREKSIAWLCAHGSVSGLRNNLSVTEEYLEGFDILCYLTAVPRAQDIRMDSAQGWVSVWERSSEETPAKPILSITPLLSTTEESPAGAAQSQGPFFYTQNILPSTHASAQSGIYLYTPFFKIKKYYLNDI